jgi:zinc protease
VPLPRIYLGHRTPTFGTDAHHALEVSADLLANGRASRLYASLVRERRLAQDVTAFVFPFVGGASMYALWATARPGVDHNELEAALLGEIDRLAADGPGEAELERVRNLHTASIESALERLGERADRISMYASLFDDPERINAEVERYRGVDAGGVRHEMADTLNGENRLVLTYLPGEPPSELAEAAAEADR